MTGRNLTMIQKLNMVTDALSRVGSGESMTAIAKEHGVSPVSLGAWCEAFQANGQAGLETGKSTGRKPLCAPDSGEIQAMRKLYVATNRAKGKGSKQLAARLHAMSTDCSEEVRHAIMKPRRSKTPPKCIRDVLTVAPAMIEIHRDPKGARLGGVHVPGTIRTTIDETTGDRRRLLAGERQSWDDASINFMVVVPWPQGGCRLSDRYGVKVGRFQLLAGVDDASGYMPGYSFVIRDLESYRAEDTVSAMYRVWRDSVLPSEVVVEGGVWQSQRAMEFYERSGVRPIDAKGRPHQKLIENYWNFLWTILSAKTDGQIGRFRGEMKRENDLLVRCKEGREDPRKHFVMLPDGLNAIDAAIHFRNLEPVESKIYGSWIPAQRWRDDLAEHPRPTVDTSLAYLHAPVREIRTVVKDVLSVRALSPLGESFTYSFTTPDLWEFTGAKVRVYFDPYDAPPSATLILDKQHGEYASGTVIATDAMCLENAPIVRRVNDAWAVGFNDATSRAVAMKREIGRAKMTEYRSLGFNGKPRVTESEYRDRDGQRISISTGSEDAPDRVETTRPSSSSSPARGPLSPAVDLLQRGRPLSPADAGWASDRGRGIHLETTSNVQRSTSNIQRRKTKEVDSDKLAAEADALEAKLRARGDLVQM